MPKAALLPTCVVDTVAPDVGASTVRVLRRLGYEVSVPSAATCCGQPAWNAGFAEASATVAATTLDALEAVADDVDVVVVPAGSCTTMMRVFWAELFEVVGRHEDAARAARLAPKVKELSELLAETDAGERAGGTLEARAAYHHSCHMLRELRIEQQPTDLLGDVDGLDLVDWPAADRCCGFGGLFSVKQPELSVAMADDKIDALLPTGADLLVGCDQSCLMHLEGRLRKRGLAVRVRHLAEVLDEAATGEGGQA